MQTSTSFFLWPNIAIVDFSDNIKQKQATQLNVTVQ